MSKMVGAQQRLGQIAKPIGIVMSRHRMLNRVKIQLAGQQRYAEPDDVLAVERELLLHAQTKWLALFATQVEGF